MTDGVAGRATILSVKRLGAPSGPDAHLELHLDVDVSTRPRYVLRHRLHVPLVLLPSFIIGSTHPVRVDPNDRDRIVLQWRRPDVPAIVTMDPITRPRPETLGELDDARSASGLRVPSPFKAGAQTSYTVEQLRAYLAEHGLPALATIDAVEDSHRIVGDDHLFSIVLTVRAAGRAPRQGPAALTAVPERAAHKVRVGAKVPVKVDPRNPELLMLEWDRVEDGGGGAGRAEG